MKPPMTALACLLATMACMAMAIHQPYKSQIPACQDLTSPIAEFGAPMTKLSGASKHELVCASSRPWQTSIVEDDWLFRGNSPTLGIRFNSVGKVEGYSLQSCFDCRSTAHSTDTRPVVGVRNIAVESLEKFRDMGKAICRLVETASIRQLSARVADFMPLWVRDHRYQLSNGFPGILELTEDCHLLHTPAPTNKEFGKKGPYWSDSSARGLFQRSASWLSANVGSNKEFCIHNLVRLRSKGLIQPYMLKRFNGKRFFNQWKSTNWTRAHDLVDRFIQLGEIDDAGARADVALPPDTLKRSNAKFESPAGFSGYLNIRRFALMHTAELMKSVAEVMDSAANQMINAATGDIALHSDS